MNNIEILEELIENYKCAYPEEESWCAIYPLQMKAIENLLIELKGTKIDLKLQETENENLIQRNKELEIKQKQIESLKHIEEDLTSVYLNGFYEGEIKWKSKIEEKIEELFKEGDYRTADNPKGRVHFHAEPVDYQL